MVGGMVNAMPGLLYPRERSGTHCTRIGGCVASMVCMDGCGKSRLNRDSNPGLSFYCHFPPAAILFLFYLLSASFFMYICIFASFVCALVLALPLTLVLLNLHVGKYPKNLIPIVRNFIINY